MSPSSSSEAKSTGRGNPDRAPSYEELPDGWVRQWDQASQHPFWVDTKADPPRAIWVHPYEDEQFLNEHPEVRERLAKSSARISEDELPPPYSPRRYSDGDLNRPSSSRTASASTTTQDQSQKGKGKGKDKERGFFGRMKDKAIGTKEEREEARRQEALYMQMRAEERKRAYQEMQRQQAEYRRQQMAAGNTRGYGNSYYYGQPSYGQQAYYSAPAGRPMNSGYESYERYGYGRTRPQSGFGAFGGGGLPILGALAGGLLLGDLIGGGF